MIKSQAQVNALILAIVEHDFGIDFLRKSLLKISIKMVSL